MKNRIENRSLKEVQKIIDDWIIQHGGYWTPLSMLASTIEELGELAREINASEGFKPKKPNERIINIGEELGDLLFSVICMANYYKVDLNEQINQIIKKYTKRDSKRFKKND
ncbi:MAG: nucleotide pyrophosphohydrolase [Candidatus Helarchaeota archaeon]